MIIDVVDLVVNQFKVGDRVTVGLDWFGGMNLIAGKGGQRKMKKSITQLTRMPRNLWAVSLTSFFNDISSEMVLNLLPLYMANVLGVRVNVIGLVEGLAESLSSLLKLFSGWFSDKIGGRKWIAVSGYAISTLAKPFFFVASTWQMVAGIRLADRVGKGIRTSPRDALVADSVGEQNRGLAFGFHRAADTAGAMLGILIALAIVWTMQKSGQVLQAGTFLTIVLLSLIPAVIAVMTLALGAKEIKAEKPVRMPKFALASLGKPFMIYLGIVALFDLGNSSDAFLVLRAQERGMGVAGILGMLAVFNLVYTLVSLPAGSLSDRLGRRKVLVGGWLVYALIYLGFGLAGTAWQVGLLYVLYGFYYGLTFGTAKAFVADLVPQNLRGTAFGTYHATLGLLDFPASAIAGVLWHGAGRWQGFGPAAPFLFGAGMSLLAVFLMVWWKPGVSLGFSGSPPGNQA